MNAMQYKKYSARIEYDAEDRIFVGHIVGIRDIVGFHGASVEELENAFHEAVDDYLAHYAKIGMPPQRPYSGKIMLRVDPDLHAALAVKAKTQGKSLNQWAAEQLATAL
jgi:predicted HicB family RNase H-like nuclease